MIERGAQLTSEHEWVIVNYDVLEKHIATLGSIPWAGLVFDEAHYDDCVGSISIHRQRLNRTSIIGKTRTGQDPSGLVLTGPLKEYW